MSVASVVGRGKTVRGNLRKRLSSHDWSFPRADNTSDLHAIHPYPAKFIPEIPRTLIKEIGVPSGTAVLDPFCGCGTTLVEAQNLGTRSIGIDLNPVACLISRVKTAPLPFDFLVAAKRALARACEIPSPRVPDIPNLSHWFQTPIQRELAALAQAIGGEGEAVRDCLRVALSSIIVRVSNQDSDTRYASVKKSVSPEAVRDAFFTACQRIFERKGDLPLRLPEARVIESDILAVRPENLPWPVGLVVTSPPYPNAYEYWLYHKYRMWWLGFDPIAVREREIGARAHYFRKNHATIDDFARQMESTLMLIQSALVPGGHVCIVIGRSRIHGRTSDNAGLITGLARKLDLTLIAKMERTIAPSRKSFNLSHARIKSEEVLVFRK